MRLRVSGDSTGNEYDLSAVMSNQAGDGGVPHSALLSAFAEGICTRDNDKTTTARAALGVLLGEAAMVDAAAVIAAFNAYPRAADATGIPLEDAKEEMTAAMRQELDLEAFLNA
jgi:hypothetical protein|tara:strand:- start:794 stop:1135 length:342 start_codon:yes stop_codon:yes gene_type:complete